MATEAQMDANRENAKKSTGPRSPEGKAASSRNGLAHGLCAEKLFLPGQNPGGFLFLLQDLESRFRPVGDTENKLVVRIAAAQWRLDCALPVEAQIYRERFHELAADQPEADLMGRAFLLDCQGPNALSKLTRYEASLERSIDRCLRQLQKLQKARAEVPPAQPNPPNNENTEQTQTNGGNGTVWLWRAGNSARSRLLAGSGRLKRRLRPRLAALQFQTNPLSGFLPAIGLNIDPTRRFRIDYTPIAVTLTVLATGQG
jgi:hypothetical protein